MIAAILLATQAQAGKWQIANVGSDGVYKSDAVTLAIDYAKAGMEYAAPYTVYHELMDTSKSFIVPVDSKGDAAWNAEFNITGWTMTVKDGSTTVSTCSGKIDSRNCDSGNWCNTPCGQNLTAQECLAAGSPEGCGTQNIDGTPTTWASDPWVKKCDGTKGGVCFSNDSSCCLASEGSIQDFPGAQFCDTVWMECAGTPVAGKTYGITVNLSGTGQWNSSTSMSKTLTTNYRYSGQKQTSAGGYACSQPSDNNTLKLCKTGEGQTNWEFSPHPLYNYNEYEFNYPSEDPAAKVVGAYWTEWAAYKRFQYDPTAVNRRYYVQNTPFHQLTHLLYAFVPICGNGPTGQGQIALCFVNDCQAQDVADLKFGNPYFNLRARACKFDASGNEAATAAATGFGQLDSDFEVVIHDPWSAFHVAGGQLLAIESAKQQNPGLKVLPSVGGWTLSKMFFYLDNAQYRAKFVASCEKFLRTWTVFDGIDIDWEFPGGGGQDDGSLVDLWQWPMDNSSKTTMATLKDQGKLTALTAEMEITGNDGLKDSNTYVAVMQDLRVMLDRLGNEFGRKYELSSAVSAGAAKIAKVEYGKVADVMDHIFIMSYDLDGAWSKKVGHQTNLFPHPGTNMDSCAGAASLINASGFPMEKLAMGVAMYGRGWKNVGTGIPEPFVNDDGSVVNGINMWGVGNDQTTACDGDVEDGVMDYSTIHYSAEKYSQYCSYFYDSCAEAPLLNCSGQVYTYDNPRSVAAKGKFVQENNMAGLFAWVLDQDDGEILNAMHEALGHQIKPGYTKVLRDSYPATTCSFVPPVTNTPAPPQNTTTAAPMATTTAAPIATTTTAPIVPPGDEICCVFVDYLDRHLECDVSSESQCLSSNACIWIEGDNCVNSIMPDGNPTSAPVLTTTAAPVTSTTAAPIATTTAAPIATTTAAPIATTTAAPIATTTAAPIATTTAAPIATTTAATVGGSECKDMRPDCPSMVYWNACTDSSITVSYGVGAGKPVSFICPETCARKATGDNVTPGLSACDYYNMSGEATKTTTTRAPDGRVCKDLREGCSSFMWWNSCTSGELISWGPQAGKPIGLACAATCESSFQGPDGVGMSACDFADLYQ